MDSVVKTNSDEKQWVIKISGILKNEVKNDVDNPICVYRVPDSIKEANPELYNPQVIAFGPYHHFKPHLYKMQRCKLHQAQLALEEFEFPDFDTVQHRLTKKISEIRNTFNDDFSIVDDTLNCLMIIDGLFLLRLMYNGFYKNGGTYYLVKSDSGSESEEKNHGSLSSSSSSSGFFDSSGTLYPVGKILKDVMKLENQIPFCVYEELLDMCGKESPDSLFYHTVLFVAKISPLELEGSWPREDISLHLHFLDMLYKLEWTGTLKTYISLAGEFSLPEGFAGRVWKALWNMLSNLNIPFVAVVKKIGDLILAVVQITGITIPNWGSEENVLIPSASQLLGVELKFCATRVGIKDGLSFDKDSVTLSLPILNLDRISEVIIHNLLAYEAMSMPDTPNFARYMNLMAALLRTVDDVEFLKKEGIVRSDIESNEVVKLFDEVSKSFSSSNDKSSKLDVTIEQVNQYFNNTRKVKIKRLVRKYLHCSWKLITVLAAILLLVLLGLQTFCSFSSCHILKTASVYFHVGGSKPL